MSWLAQQTTALDAARSAAELAANWLIQSTLLIAAGLAVGRLLQNRGAAVQSAVYRTTLLAVAICPWATLTLHLMGFSGWSVAMPSAYEVAAVAEVAAPASASTTAEPQPAAGALLAPMPAMHSEFGDTLSAMPEGSAAGLPLGAGGAKMPGEIDSQQLAPDASLSAEALTPSEQVAVSTDGAANRVDVHRFGIFALVAGMLWALAAAGLLTRLLVAWRRLERIRRDASPAAAPTTEICRELAQRMKLAPPSVLHSAYLPSPCLAGIRRPAIMLPDEDSQQPTLPVRDVLVHELAHLRRRDCHWNLMRRATTSVLWFQPLLWLLARRLEASAEEVCDDYVVQLGGDRHSYARRLVDIAELSATPFAAAGVAMVSIRTMLERRVRRIMDTSRSLSTRVGNVLLALVLIAGAVGTIAVGLVGAGARVSEAQTKSQKTEAAAEGGPEAGESERQTPPTSIGERESAEPAMVDDPRDNGSINSAQKGDESKAKEPARRHFTGVVLDDAGQPVANATVIAVRIIATSTDVVNWSPRYKPEYKVIVETKTSDSGAFELKFDTFDSAFDPKLQNWQIVAHAPGYGPAWMHRRNALETSSLELRLSADQPIRGRVVDLEGMPLAGVRVAVEEIRLATSEEAIDKWIDEVQADPSPRFNATAYWGSSQTRAFPAQWRHGELEGPSPGVPAEQMTGADGRFEVRNVGANRLAVLVLEGENVAKTLLPVVTREMAPLEASPILGVGYRSGMYFGARCEFVAEPTQLVHGHVRDAETGQPIRGIEVRLSQFADNIMSQDGFVSARTDDEGHYRLVGLPAGGGHKIEVAPAVGDPYFLTRQTLKKTPAASGPHQCDIELRRGRWISGNVTEKASGDPIADAVVEYLPLRSNKNAPQYKNYRPEITGSIPSERFHTDANGRFRVLAIPGDGVLAAIVKQEDRENFAAVTPEALPEDLVDERGNLNAYEPWTVTGYYALRKIDLSDDQQEASYHLECVRGGTRRLEFVDSDGEPVGGARVLGRTFPPQFEEPIESGSIELVGLSSQEERLVAVVQEERRIGRILKVISGDDPLNVVLQPCAIARGRVVDEDGAPQPDLRMQVSLDDEDNWFRGLGEAETDADGRFELLLPPGETVRVSHYEPDGISVSAQCEAKPGVVFDLGDLRDGAKLTIEQTARIATGAAVDAGEGEAPNGGEAEPTKEPTEYAGSVATPDGKPAANADLYLVYHIPEPTGLLTPTWKPVAQTDSEGRFRFKLDSDQGQHGSLVAVKDGYGFAWSEAAFHETSGRLLNELKARAADAAGVFGEQFAARLKRAGQPLQLVADDEPIRGRIVDINGQPVANARLTLREVSASLEGDLSAWRAAAKADKADYYSARTATPLMMNGPQVRSIVKPATTDAEGRFTLRGVGQGRIAELIVEGPGIETVKLLARTEAGEAIELERERRAPHGKYIYHPSEFTHVAGPSIPIAGVVRDANTGAPLAGITVKSQSRHGEPINGWGQDFVRAVTDSEGRYELGGMPIGAENRIAAIAPDDEPYLSMSHEAPTSADQNSHTVKFDLQRGVWVEGRVTDKQSGEGLAGTLKYYVPATNPHYKLTRHMHVDERDRLRADREGRFRIVCLPGPGFIAFQAEDHQNYPRATAITRADGTRVKAEEYLTNTGPSYLMLANYHVVAEIDLKESAKRYKLDLELDGGATVTGRVVDADGKPVTGFYFSGRIARFESWRPGKGDVFEVTGVEADAPRDVYFAHGERNLAGHTKITGDEAKDLVVPLQPAGTVKGRLVDADGEPLANYVLHRWSSSISSPGDLNNIRRAPPLPPSNDHTQVGEHETDADGRFEIPCLVPGVEYRIRAYHRDNMSMPRSRPLRASGELERVVVVEAGQTLDLGDVAIVDREAASQARKRVKKKPGASDQLAANQAAVVAAEAKRASTSRDKDGEPKAAAKTVAGRVVDADGKPVAGAKLHWITWSLRGPQPEPKLVAATNDSGDFNFSLPDWRLESGETGARRPMDQLIVTAPGHGMRVLMPHEVEATKPSVLGSIAQALGAGGPDELSIQLPKAAPIRGRIVDVDGQPVAGARITLRKLSSDKDANLQFAKQSLQGRGETENLDVWARALSLEQHFYPQRLAEVAPSATSGADGRFELDGIGAEAIVELLIAGDGIESDLILVRASPDEAITLKSDGNFQLEDRTLHGSELTHVAGPSKPVAGRVVDYDTGEPVAGAIVRTYAVHGERLNSSRNRQHLVAITDDEGRYRIAGLPIGDENRLIAFTVGEEPYVPIGALADTSTDEPSLALDFRLKRGVWAVGKAYDSVTKEPLTGELTYYIFPDPKLKEELPGLRQAFLDEHYFTAADGSYRVPVLASRGVLAFRYDPAGMGDVTKYPRGAGANDIKGINGDNGLPMFETWPHYLVPSNYQFVKEVSPAQGEQNIRIDFPLATGKRITVQPVDESGKPLADVEFYGRTDSYGWQKKSGAGYEVTNLLPGESRKVLFYDRQRNLAGAAEVDENTPAGFKVTLVPAAVLKGRLVDEDGVKIIDAVLQPDLEKFRGVEHAAIWPDDPQAVTNMDDVRTEGGEFRIVGLVPGWSYSAWATAPRKMDGRMMNIGIGRAFDDVTLEPGEERDLGDLVVTYNKPEAKPKASKKKAAPVDEKKLADESKSSSRSTSLRVHGQIRTPNGEPLSGVDVAVISMPIAVQRGGDLKPRGAALFETTTDDAGRYSLQLSGLSAETHRYTSLIARADGSALAWKRLDLNGNGIEASFDLRPEQPLTIQLVDIEGQPAAGVRVNAVAVMPTIVDDRPPTDGAGFQDALQAPKAWFRPMTADDQGLITIHNLAAGHGVALEVEGDDRFAPQDLALNTGMPEQRGERDATYRSQVVNKVKPGEVRSIPLSPAQQFTGVIRYEDSGEPAPHARLTIWASQQEEFGSMSSVAGVADAQGRYRISPQPGVRFGVTAYPPDGAPYLGRQAEPVRWDAGDESKQVDVSLPRGVLVRGRVIEDGSEAAIAGASIQFIAERATSNEVPKGAITGWQNRQISDDEGRFRIVVPAGEGRLIVHGPSNEYVIVETSSRELYDGRPGGERNYAHAIERIEPDIDAEPLKVTLRLKSADSASGMLVGPDGKPIESALMITRLAIHPNWLDWHAHASLELTGGRFKLSGLTPGEEYQVLFLDQKRKLGGVATLKGGMERQRVVLKPCGNATMRFVDSAGRPAPEINPTVQLVVTPGSYQFDTKARKRGELAADADFISNVDRLNHPGNEETDDDGRLEIGALIPGATYRVVHGGNGDKFRTTDFVAKSGATVDVGELMLEIDNN